MKPATKSRRPLIQTGVLALALMAALYSSYRVGHAFAEWRQPLGRHLRQTGAAFALNPLSVGLTAGGHWQFANLNWDFHCRTLPAADVEQRFEAMINQPN